MQLAFGLPWVLLALPPVLGLVWWWYRRRRPPERKIAGLWLWQKAQRKGRARRRVDWRLLLLLLAAALGLLALSNPRASLDLPGALVVVLDTSASMAATDVAPSRLEQAKEQARGRLERSPNAVLVVAGRQNQVFGPAIGRTLLDELDAASVSPSGADLEGAIAQGRRRLPNAPVLLVSDTPSPAADGYVNVAGNGQNIGVTAVSSGFVGLANSGPGPWRGTVTVNGRSFPAEVPSGGYRGLEVPFANPNVRIQGSDALSLDNTGQFSRRPVRVSVSGSAPALERLLGLLGTVRGGPTELAFEVGVPGGDPGRFTVYFAPRAEGQAVVFDAERTLPYLRGAELVGYRLSVPPRPSGPNWRPLAVDESARVLAWYHPNGLYLPPAQTLQDLPAFPVLVFNLVAPRGETRSGLLTPAETLLPRPAPDVPLPPALTVWLAPWLALLAVAVLGLELLFFQRGLWRSASSDAARAGPPVGA